MNKKALSRATSGLCAILGVIFLVGILLNSRTFESATVRLASGATEHKDKSLLGFGAADSAPDYNLRLHVGKDMSGLRHLFEHEDRSGLIFKPAEMVSLRRVLEMQLRDRDKVESDILEQLPISSEEFRGSNYLFEIPPPRAFTRVSTGSSALRSERSPRGRSCLS